MVPGSPLKMSISRPVAAALMLWAGVLFSIGPAAPARADETEDLPPQIVVTEKECRKLIRYAPDGDVAYRPGVDVHGRSVAPADVPGSRRIELPETIAIDITVNIYEYLGVAAPVGMGETAADFGTVELKRGPLSDPVFDGVVALCREEFAD